MAQTFGTPDKNTKKYEAVQHFELYLHEGIGTSNPQNADIAIEPGDTIFGIKTIQPGPVPVNQLPAPVLLMSVSDPFNFGVYIEFYVPMSYVKLANLTPKQISSDKRPVLTFGRLPINAH